MPERILVGHDLGCAAYIVTRMLVLHGYDARAAYRPSDLLEIAARWKPHGAVLDLSMHAGGALEVARELRARFGNAIHLVGFTLPGAASVAASAIEAGFDEVVVDVLDPGEVLLAMGGPAADLVRRGRQAMFERACVMIELGHRRLRLHRQLPDAHRRRDSVATIWRSTEWVRVYLQSRALNIEQQTYVELELETLASELAALESGGAAPGDML